MAETLIKELLERIEKLEKRVRFLENYRDGNYNIEH